MFTNKKSSNFYNYRNGNMTAYHGYFTLILENGNLFCNVSTMNFAAERGQLQVVKYLHKFRTEGCTTHAIDASARSEHLNIIKFLHSNRSEGCTKYTLELYVKAQRHEIVKWLKSNRKEFA